MIALPVALLLALQAANPMFDLVCEIESSNAPEVVRYSVDLEGGEWCRRQEFDAEGPKCTAEDRRDVAFSGGRYLMMWADETGYQAVSLDTGFLSGGREGDHEPGWRGRCLIAPFSGW